MNTTAFDAYLKGTNRTYSNDPKQNITDSAAGATAFSSDIKHIMALLVLTVTNKS